MRLDSKIPMFNQKREAPKLVKKLPLGINGIKVDKINNAEESNITLLFLKYKKKDLNKI